MSKTLMRGRLLSGAIRIASGEYFINRFIHLRGGDITMFGDGITAVFHLEHPVFLKDHNKS